MTLGRILVTLSLATGLLATPAPALAAPPVDLEGTWFVLIHYKDPSSANPDATRWLDRVWAFAPKGSRLQWTEYPMVVFEDTAGRFEAARGNPRSRVLDAWEPNANQAQTIAAGPRVNTRGSKTKTLRGSDRAGWQSSQRRPQTSARVMGYHEQLSIEGLDGDADSLPVFERRDIVGNALTTGGDGLTRYRVTEIRDGGQTLAGAYERDDRLHGSFRLWRTAPVRSLVKKKGTPNERAAEALMKGQPDQNPAF